MADSSFRRELVRAALPGAIEACHDRSRVGLTEESIQRAADLAVQIAMRTDEVYSRFIAMEKDAREKPRSG